MRPGSFPQPYPSRAGPADRTNHPERRPASLHNPIQYREVSKMPSTHLLEPYLLPCFSIFLPYPDRCHGYAGTPQVSNRCHGYAGTPQVP